MKSILHICSFYTSTNLYKNLIMALNSKGLNNSIFVPCRVSDVKHKNDDIDISYYSAFKDGNTLLEKITNIYEQYEFYKLTSRIYTNLKEQYNVNKYDFIHAHSLYINGYLAYKLYKEFGIEYIVAIRNTDVNVYLKHAIHLRKLGMDVMRNAKNIIFISESYKEEVLNKYVPKDEIQKFKNKSLVIPNGIDEYWISEELDKQKVMDKDCIKLIQVGRIDKNKNVTTSIKICETLNNMGIHSTLTIVGDGPLKRKYMNEYKNHDKITFKEKAPKEIIKKYFDNSDIFIMLSKYETFGLVYPEAMSRGLPVLYTKNQGFDKYFKDGEVGYPIRYNDFVDGVKKVKMIISDYNDFSTNAYREHKQFSWVKISEIYKNIYLKE